MANTVKTETGIEVYEDNIKMLADDYIDTLDNPDDIKTNRGLFTGMIKYIYMQYFKINNINYDDIDTLDNIFNIYTSLCYRYGKRPTLLNFSIMIGISMDTLNTWKTGEYRGGVGSRHSETVKRWLKECESTLVDGAIENNSIGCIFALKANYGYVETAQRIEISTKDQAKTAEQIIAERMPELSQNDRQLELPDGDF